MKRVVPSWLSIIMLILSVGSIAYYFYRTIVAITAGVNALFVITLILWILSGLAALLYLLAGYRKKAANFYSAFFIIYSVTWMFMIFAYAMTGFSFYLIPVVIAFGATSVIAGTQNLGKGASYTCGVIICLCALGEVLPQMNLIITVGNITGSYGACANLVFVALSMIMIYAKYADKDTRGTI